MAHLLGEPLSSQLVTWCHSVLQVLLEFTLTLTTIFQLSPDTTSFEVPYDFYLKANLKKFGEICLLLNQVPLVLLKLLLSSEAIRPLDLQKNIRKKHTLEVTGMFFDSTNLI